MIHKGVWLPNDTVTPGDIFFPMRNLTALYDPYREYRERNCLAVGAETFQTNCWVPGDGTGSFTVAPGAPDPLGGTSAYRITCTANGVGRVLIKTIPHTKALADPVAAGMWIKTVSGFTDASLALSLGAGDDVIKGPAIDEWRQCITVLRGSGATSWDLQIKLDSTPASGQVFVFDVFRPQANYADVLALYTPPSGHPSTWQTALDFSGNAYHLTYGGSTNVATDDPRHDGLSWYFDGGDYLTRSALPELGVRQPFCGYIVAHQMGGGEVAILAQQNVIEAGPTGKGFMAMLYGSIAEMYFYGSNYNGRVQVSLEPSNATTGMYFGWDGQFGIASVTRTSGGDFPIVETLQTGYVPCPDCSFTLGRANGDSPYYFVGRTYFACLWTGFCWRGEDIRRLHRYMLRVMARRGVSIG